MSLQKILFLLFIFLGIRFSWSSAQSPALVSSIGPTSASIYWPESADHDQAIRYCIAGTNQWITKYTGELTSISISNLQPKTHYYYQVKTGVQNGIEEWSPTSEFFTIARPNLLVIVVDDGRYDNYTINGGPDFFQSPNINRIANEGVNFKFCFPGTSLCSPSRASIVTGLYSHHHGIINNSISDSLTIPTIATILQDSGYYTGFVGKYGFNKWPVPGYDYWLESSNDYYWDTYYSTPSGWVYLPGHKTERFTDAAIDFLNSVPPDKPFCLFLEHKAPHVPLEPRNQDTGLYKADTMPLPPNFYSYGNDFPSYYYDCHNFGGNLDTMQFQLLRYYQLLAGVEWSVGKVLNKLENKGMLDSTLIIYTSDNGLLKGEHDLSGKQLALEESLRLPMFIRYPAWFNTDSGIVITDQMAMNIDIAPTMLDAAGITSPVPMDGWSLHDLATGLKQRKELLYEFYNNEECTPTIHAIRTFDHIYIHNSCDSVTEEFYDLVNDSSENQNLINDPSLQSQIQEYRVKLDSIRVYYGDTVWMDTAITCHLVAGIPIGTNNEEDAEFAIHAFPNPAWTNITLNWDGSGNEEVDIIVHDLMGCEVFRKHYPHIWMQHNEKLQIDLWMRGVYFITLRSGEQQQVIKFLKQE